MIPKAVLARLRKCLAMSKSANEHEAANALEMVRRIMEEHRLTESDVELSEVNEAAARGSRTQQPTKWEAFLCASVRRALGVEVFIDQNLDRRYVGRGAAPEIASYAFVVLYRQLKRARTDYIKTSLKRCGPASKRRRADAFCEGWAQAVLLKIIRIAPEAEPDELVGRYLAERHPGLVEINNRGAQLGRRSRDDFWRGWDEGREAQLQGGVGANAQPLQLEAK